MKKIMIINLVFAIAVITLFKDFVKELNNIKIHIDIKITMSNEITIYDDKSIYVKLFIVVEVYFI